MNRLEGQLVADSVTNGRILTLAIILVRPQDSSQPAEIAWSCIVRKSLTLYTHGLVMGKRNKAVKLTRRKINYIIRNKINGNSTKEIAADMKVSISTVKRVWMYYLKNREAVPIKKSGRKKKEIDAEVRDQILEIHKEQKLVQGVSKRLSSINFISMSPIMRFTKFCSERDWL